MNKRKQTEAVGSFWIWFSMDEFELLIFAKSDTASYQRPDTLTTIGPVQIPLTKGGRWVLLRVRDQPFHPPRMWTNSPKVTKPISARTFLISITLPQGVLWQASGSIFIRTKSRSPYCTVTKMPSYAGGWRGGTQKSKDPQTSGQCTCTHIPQMDARGSISPYPTLPRRCPMSICQSFWWVWVWN